MQRRQSHAHPSPFESVRNRALARVGKGARRVPGDAQALNPPQDLHDQKDRDRGIGGILGANGQGPRDHALALGPLVSGHAGDGDSTPTLMFGDKIRRVLGHFHD